MFIDARLALQRKCCINTHANKKMYGSIKGSGSDVDKVWDEGMKMQCKWALNRYRYFMSVRCMCCFAGQTGVFVVVKVKQVYLLF